MPSIFVVEDDQRLLQELTRLLSSEGMHCVACQGFFNVAAQVIMEAPDCVLLDVMVPGTDGRMIAREIRRFSDVPILMLTCLDSEFDEVSAMESGADGYLTKPYRPQALLAHIRAALRRNDTAAKTLLYHAGLELDVASGTVRFEPPHLLDDEASLPAGGMEAASSAGAGALASAAAPASVPAAASTSATADLTRNEARILALLMRNPGCVVTRQEIMCELWESDAFVDDNTLTVNVNRLRRTLELIGAPRDYIKTRRGEGYLVS